MLIKHLFTIDDGPTDKNISAKDKEILQWINFEDVEKVLSYDNLKSFWLNIKDLIFEIFKSNGILSPGILTDLEICSSYYEKENK